MCHFIVMVTITKIEGKRGMIIVITFVLTVPLVSWYVFCDNSKTPDMYTLTFIFVTFKMFTPDSFTLLVTQEGTEFSQYIERKWSYDFL